MRRPERAAGLLALVLGLLHSWLAPDTGTDLAAQLARASFARAAPLTPVDLSWYGGVHPYGYSLLSPWVMGVLGVQLAGLLAAVAGSVLLARLFRSSARPLLASLVGAVLLTGDVVSGRTTFALGAVAGLAALCAIPRRPVVGALGVLTALVSPVAAAVLGLFAAVLVLHRRPGGWTLGVSATVPVVVLAVAFPGGGVQPFTTRSAVGAVLSALALAALTSVPLVRTGALLYALTVLTFLAFDDPFGSNVLRLGLLGTSAVLLATVSRRGLLVLAVTLPVLAWQAAPVWGDLRAPDGPPLGAVRAELVRLDARRVEVVAARDHRESWYVAERVPLARGWARQQDRVLNPLFYEGSLDRGEFVDWLHAHAVDHVAVPRHGKLDFGSTREAGVLAAGGTVAPFRMVWQDDDWVVYDVPEAVPIAPGVLSSTRTTLTMQLEPGAVDVSVRWSRWLSVTGPACLERHGDLVRLHVDRAGIITLGSGLTPKGHCP